MVVTNDDVRRLSAEELRNTNENFDINAERLRFPSVYHHFTVKAKLNALADQGAMSIEKSDELYQEWREQ